MFRCSSPRPEWVSHKTAQGNSLGDDARKTGYRPERAKQCLRTAWVRISASNLSIARGSPIVPPLQGLNMVWIRGPRAMPWADLLCPFGRDQNCARPKWRFRLVFAGRGTIGAARWRFSTLGLFFSSPEWVCHKTAQGNSLGFDARNTGHRPERANQCLRTASAQDFRDTSARGARVSDCAALTGLRIWFGFEEPGRCPGLICCALSGQEPKRARSKLALRVGVCGKAPSARLAGALG